MKEQLIHKATYLTKNEFEKFQVAISFAEQAHEGQFHINLKIPFPSIAIYLINVCKQRSKSKITR